MGNVMEESQKTIYIDCIGVDNKRHICEPHSDYCFCGIKVKTKKDSDVRNSKILYSCYECTY